jgi:hypothetical protein
MGVPKVARRGAFGKCGAPPGRLFPSFRTAITRLEAARSRLMFGVRRGGGPIGPPSILELALERLDLVGKRAVVGGERLDLAHGVQHGGVVAPAKSPADLRQRA